MERERETIARGKIDEAYAYRGLPQKAKGALHPVAQDHAPTTQPDRRDPAFKTHDRPQSEFS
ncbi:MAG: hypothetical protein LBL35_01475 [Clostridiales bacterium]|jgi:hypothetical protein|nr:hypothetical protein [Clostridiales bacterium]